MNAFEIATAVQAKLPLVIFVINDGRLGMVEIGNTIVYGRTPKFPTGPMDIAQLAAGARRAQRRRREVRRRSATPASGAAQARPGGGRRAHRPDVKIPKRDRFVGFNSQSAASAPTLN